MNIATESHSVVDLFSGGGGMSCGFHRHPAFKLVAAADAELGKPSMGSGSLECNATYEANMGFAPARIDLATIPPGDLGRLLGLNAGQRVSVLSVCPPCTGFSRANPENHVRDDPRNSLVKRAADFALALDAEIVVMENARELVRGNFRDHLNAFLETLTKAGYQTSAGVHMLTRFGLPQIRERALVMAVKNHLTLHTLEDLWDDWIVTESAVTVREAFRAIPRTASGLNDYPSIQNPQVLARLRAIPANGGSWSQLIAHPDGQTLMTPAMKRLVERKKLGSHPDVYGRMSWDKPAPTIKRECAHIGNGRYAHPVEDRLCSVREMAALQGFPHDFRIEGSSLSNRYRHLGDAVPPLVSFQLAHLCEWILTGKPKEPSDVLLPGTHLKPTHLRRSIQPRLLQYA